MGGGLLGGLALVAIMFGAVTSNALNDYSGSLAAQAGGVRIKRHVSAVIGTVVAYFLILWLNTGDVSAKFQNVLLFTAYWIAPFLAVVAIDWRDRRDGVNRETLVHMLEWRNLRSGWPALLSLVVGFGLMVPFMDTGLVVGPVARRLDGADLSFVVGFVVAGALYYPLRRLAAHPAQPRSRPSHWGRTAPPRWRQAPRRAPEPDRTGDAGGTTEAHPLRRPVGRWSGVVCTLVGRLVTFGPNGSGGSAVGSRWAFCEWGSER